MTESGQDKEALLLAAYNLFDESSLEFTEQKAIEKLEQLAPGFSNRQYKTAWSKVISLFDNACRLVFRWSADKPPGTTFELPDENKVFLEELRKDCRGFTDEQYLRALEYGFKKAIF